MRDPHEPREEFVSRLELQLGAEARRRNRVAARSPSPGWLQSKIRLAIAITVLVLVSMAIGGAVVAATYQAQTNEQRSLLVAKYQKGLEVARLRLQAAMEALRTVEESLSRGIASHLDVLEEQAKVTEARAQVQTGELQLQEVQLTGQESRDEVSAPLVSGRDFVSERWRIAVSVPAAALNLERTKLGDAQDHLKIGTGSQMDVLMSESRVVELQAAVQALQRKLDIRRQFLGHDISANMAALRVLEDEADQRRTALVPKVNLARQNVDALNRKFHVGLAQKVEVAEAQLNLQELQADLAKAELDLALIRRQIDQQRGKDGA